MKQFIMFLTMNGGNSTLCMDHQFAARWNSLIVFGELVLDEKTSTFFFFMKVTTLQKIELYICVGEQKTVIPGILSCEQNTKFGKKL